MTTSVARAPNTEQPSGTIERAERSGTCETPVSSATSATKARARSTQEARAGTDTLLAAFNRSLKTLRSEGKGFSDALPVLRQMHETETEFDVMTYTHLIGMCGRSADSRIALELLEELHVQQMKVPVSTYSTFLATCARSNDLPRARVGWNRMIRYGVSPSPQACGAFIDCLARSGLTFEAKQILETYPLGNTLISRTSLVSGLARAGKVEDATEALDDMRKAGFSPNVRAYTAIIHALGKQKRSSEAIAMFKRAQEARVQTDALIFEATISACGASGDVDSAFKLLRMMLDQRLSLTDRAYQGLMYACIASNHVRRAMVVYRAACDAGMDTPRVMSAIASAVLRENCDPELSKQLLQRMERYLGQTDEATMRRHGVDFSNISKKVKDLRRVLRNGRKDAAIAAD